MSKVVFHSGVVLRGGLSTVVYWKHHHRTHKSFGTTSALTINCSIYAIYIYLSNYIYHTCTRSCRYFTETWRAVLNISVHFMYTYYNDLRLAALVVWHSKSCMIRVSVYCYCVARWGCAGVSMNCSTVKRFQRESACGGRAETPAIKS